MFGVEAGRSVWSGEVPSGCLRRVGSLDVGEGVGAFKVGWLDEEQCAHSSGMQACPGKAHLSQQKGERPDTGWVAAPGAGTNHADGKR